jgi:hypothetical protein
MHMYRSKSRTAFANEDELSPPRLVTNVKFVDNEMRSHLYRGRWLGLPWLLNDVISDFTLNDADRRSEWALVRFMPWSQLFCWCITGNGDAERSLQRKISITLPKDSPSKSVSPKDLWEIQGRYCFVYCISLLPNHSLLTELSKISSSVSYVCGMYQNLSVR